MGILAAEVAAVLAVTLPPLLVTRSSVLLVLPWGTGVRLELVLTFLVVLAHSATCTYVTPFLGQVT